MPSAEIAAVAEYLRALDAVHRSGAGVAEPSYYPALSNLLNAIGATLNPKVTCVLQLRNRGEGQPDGGLFTAQQKPNQRPDRGAVEAKAVTSDLDQLAAGEQVERYWRGYGQVLATNLRAFTIIGTAPAAPPAPARFETCVLAASTDELWQLTANPALAARAHGARLAEFLKRALQLRATLGAPEDVAFFLASYAREALSRIEGVPLEDLAGLRSALESALGLTFTGEKGEHFFRSSLIQALFYGLFSAWALEAQKNPALPMPPFRWREAAWLLRLPVLRKLFYELADPQHLRSLRLAELLDWTAAALDSVRRSEFFSRFRAGEAVQYFYEPFLDAFDPELRRDLGVWYTPPEIVEYMVARVDAVLRSELGIERGLADPNVLILDPCCGTGSFLMEVLRVIQRTLGGAGLAAAEVRQAAVERVFGFEILPAPFVIAHLQIGMYLAQAALAFEPDQRAAVFLTNALTGWEPPAKETHRIPWAELEQERASSGRIKREAKVLVVIGNPPYNAFAGVSPAEEQGLVDPYKQGLITEWGIKKFNLDDLYIRFFRIAERRVAEMTGRGIVCFISNYSWLRDPSFVVMRRHLLQNFSSSWIDNLNGDSRQTGKRTPDGRPDPSVFSTEFSPRGIKVGTAVATLTRSKRRSPPAVAYREFWGQQKRHDLVASLKSLVPAFEPATPTAKNRYSFRPEHVSSAYLSWPRIPDLCATPPLNGLMEKRGGALIDIDPDALADRMRTYYDRKLSWEAYKAAGGALAIRRARYQPHAARKKAVAQERFSPRRLLRYAVRPFDTRWAYYTAVRPIWNEPRPALYEQLWHGNRFLLSRPAGVASPEGIPFSFSSILGDNDYLRGHAYFIPFSLRDGIEPDPDEPRLLDDGGRVQTTNLSPLVRQRLTQLGFRHLDLPEIADLVWHHVLAVGFSPRYLADHADGIRQDWPRIPLPASRAQWEQSAALGAKLAALLDSEAAPALPSGVAEPRHLGGGAVRPAACRVTAGWGRAGREGVVMPGPGKTRRHSGLIDVYANDEIYWADIPSAVWEFFIGGYPVLKKWLSYREGTALGRALTLAELREFQTIASRLAGIVALQPALDASYLALLTPAPPPASRGRSR